MPDLYDGLGFPTHFEELQISAWNEEITYTLLYAFSVAASAADVKSTDSVPVGGRAFRCQR